MRRFVFFALAAMLLVGQSAAMAQQQRAKIVSSTDSCLRGYVVPLPTDSIIDSIAIIHPSLAARAQEIVSEGITRQLPQVAVAMAEKERALAEADSEERVNLIAQCQELKKVRERLLTPSRFNKICHIWQIAQDKYALSIRLGTEAGSFGSGIYVYRFLEEGHLYPAYPWLPADTLEQMLQEISRDSDPELFAVLEAMDRQRNPYKQLSLQNRDNYLYGAIPVGPQASVLALQEFSVWAVSAMLTYLAVKNSGAIKGDPLRRGYEALTAATFATATTLLSEQIRDDLADQPDEDAQAYLERGIGGLLGYLVAEEVRQFGEQAGGPKEEPKEPKEPGQGEKVWEKIKKMAEKAKSSAKQQAERLAERLSPGRTNTQPWQQIKVSQELGQAIALVLGYYVSTYGDLFDLMGGAEKFADAKHWASQTSAFGEPEPEPEPGDIFTLLRDVGRLEKLNLMMDRFEDILSGVLSLDWTPDGSRPALGTMGGRFGDMYRSSVAFQTQDQYPDIQWGVVAEETNSTLAVAFTGVDHHGNSLTLVVVRGVRGEEDVRMIIESQGANSRAEWELSSPEIRNRIFEIWQEKAEPLRLVHTELYADVLESIFRDEAPTQAMAEVIENDPKLFLGFVELALQFQEEVNIATFRERLGEILNKTQRDFNAVLVDKEAEGWLYRHLGLFREEGFGAGSEAWHVKPARNLSAEAGQNFLRLLEALHGVFFQAEAGEFSSGVLADPVLRPRYWRLIEASTNGQNPLEVEAARQELLRVYLNVLSFPIYEIGFERQIDVAIRSFLRPAAYHFDWIYAEYIQYLEMYVPADADAASARIADYPELISAIELLPQNLGFSIAHTSRQQSVERQFEAAVWRPQVVEINELISELKSMAGVGINRSTANIGRVQKILQAIRSIDQGRL